MKPLWKISGVSRKHRNPATVQVRAGDYFDARRIVRMRHRELIVRDVVLMEDDAAARARAIEAAR